MSNLVQLEMTLEEAQETDRLIKRHINTTRYLLLDMRDRKGWKALGYESFKEYGEKALGYEERHIYRLVDAAEIGLQIETAQLDSQPSESQLRPLKAVPEAVRKEIWDEATRKATEENEKLTAKRVEEAVKDWKRRSDEFKDESNERRKRVRELEAQIDLLTTAGKSDDTQIIPVDYQETKDKAATLERELEKLKAEQQSIIDSQVRAKLRGYQDEVDAMERKKAQLDDDLARKRAFLDSLDSERKGIESQRKTIDEERVRLVNLAASLSDMRPTSDAETVRQWRALAAMHRDAADAIEDLYPPKPRLEIVPHA